MDPATQSKINIAELLDTMLTAGRTVILSRCPEGWYIGTSGSGRSIRHGNTLSLEGVVESISDHPRTKVCIREDCSSKGKPISIWCFGPDKDAADKRAAVCRPCESRRIRQIAVRKLQQAKAKGKEDGKVV